MRIGLFLIQFPAPSETFIVTKVIGLLAAGVDVRIFTAHASPHWERFEILKGRDDIRRRVRVLPPADSIWKAIVTGMPRLIGAAIRCPFAFLRYVRHNWRHRHQNPLGFWRALYLRSPFVGQQLDILHIEFDSQGAHLVDLKEYFNCKLLLSSRDVMQRVSTFYSVPDLPARLFRFADGYHVLAEWLRGNLLNLGLSSRVLVRIIPPAIDVDLFAPSPRPTAHPLTPSPQPLEILSVGRIAWAKGYEFAIDAVRQMRDAGVTVHYTILGAGPYEEAIHFAARQNGLLQNGTVTFAGAVGREATTAYYRQSDIFLHAALEEGFCNAVIEAQAMALPVVTSDANGLPENVADGVTGFVVPRRDPQALADKLLLLARDPKLRARLGQAGRERAITHFNLRNYTPQFLQLYQDVLASR
jgi:colanic acid/amylovoran biosynthesis glycosyltransferase